MIPINVPLDFNGGNAQSSLRLIQDLVQHRAEGSLYDALKGLNFAQDLIIDTNTSIQSPFRLLTLEIELTFEGLKNYKKVIAIVFEYFRIVREDWLADGKQL